MGKDRIRLLVAINKRLNFWTQRDSKILAGIDSNSLENYCPIRLSVTRRSMRSFVVDRTCSATVTPQNLPITGPFSA